MTDIIVNGSSELNAAIKVAKAGDNILLKAGTYTGIDIRNVNIDGAVNVTSLGEKSSVKLIDLSIKDSSGFNFSDMEVVADQSRPYGTVEIFDSKNFTFSNLNVHGTLNSNPFDDFDGFRVSRSENIKIVDSEFHDLHIAVGHGDSKGVTVSGNDFHHIGMDGVRGGGSSNVLISGNHFWAFTHQEGDHADAIQFYPGSLNKVATNIVVTGNVIDSSQGDVTQGIFMRNDETAVFEKVQISDNLVIAGNHNGIYVERVNGLNITNNEVISKAGHDSWVRVIDAVDGVISGNAAAVFMLGKAGDVVESGNTINSILTGDAASLVNAWLEKLGGGLFEPPVVNPPVVSPPVVSPPVTPPVVEQPEPAPPSGGMEAPVATPPADAVTSGVTTILAKADLALKLTGTAKINGTGNTLDNHLLGNDGDNRLVGLEGDDIFEGRLGNDTMDGGAGIDTASYSQSTGGVRADLGKNLAQNTVSAGMDKFVSVENLSGSRYADTLSGSSGSNVISGGAGDDVIYGGAGSDDLFGGAGADTFVFRNVADSGVAADLRDAIYDFNAGKGDVIDLSSIDASTLRTGNQAFQAVEAFSKTAGELTITARGGEMYEVAGDVNGDGQADFTLNVYAEGSFGSGNFLL